MLLVTRDDVEARLGRALTEDEDARFDAAAADVSAYLLVLAPRIPRTPPIPAAVTAVACELIVEKLSSGGGSSAGIASESLGGYSVTYRTDGGSGSGSLSDAQHVALRPWRAPSFGSVPIDPVMGVVRG